MCRWVGGGSAMCGGGGLPCAGGVGGVGYGSGRPKARVRALGAVFLTGVWEWPGGSEGQER